MPPPRFVVDEAVVACRFIEIVNGCAGAVVGVTGVVESIRLPRADDDDESF